MTATPDGAPAHPSEPRPQPEVAALGEVAGIERVEGHLLCREVGRHFDVSCIEIAQDGSEFAEVVRRWVRADIEVLRTTHVSVHADRDPADDDEADAGARERQEERVKRFAHRVSAPD